MAVSRLLRNFTLGCLVLLVAATAFGQQVGAVSGKVTATDGSALPGVTVEARSTSLPQPRVSVTNEAGDYHLPALQPGKYTISYTLAGMQTVNRTVQVLLNQDSIVNVALGMQGVSESITVTAAATMVDPTTTTVKSAVAEEEIASLPTGQEYRDLVKLAPGVQYTEDAIRGPSAGGSGQDNTYQFDGVNVTLPLFGTLAAEPSSHDIAQVSVVKGGAKAVDFNRAAGFTIDSVSKSGTSEWKGSLSYQFQNDSMRGDVIGTSVSQFDQSRDWLTANIGGPVLRDRLFFYGSYYRPTVDRTGRRNVYGELPDYDSTRNEYFGKLTYTPIGSVLINGSYRDSKREVTNASIGGFSAPSTALDEEASQKIKILEASWVVNSRSLVTAKFNDYLNETLSIPNNVLDAIPTLTLGTKLDVNNLGNYGNFFIPTPITGQTAFNTFIQPLIDKYGYVNSAGVKVGGGDIGAGSQINDQDFFRKSAQLGYDMTAGSKMAHDIHIGYQWFKDGEDLARISNGWGALSVVGGRLNCPAGTQCAGQPYYYLSTFTRSALGGAFGGNNIHSEYRSHNIEVNDTIRWGAWSFNAGVLVSNDTLYGQGLKEDSSTLSGYVLAPGHKYKMYEIPWEKTIQPRLGATWTYNGSDNVYASYAKYVPNASSLPRAASWDRSILGLTSRAYFDVNGSMIGFDQVGSSSGKLFVDDLDPRYTDEYLMGTSQQFTNRWSGRAYARYRYTTNFWEDTNNDARQRWAPANWPSHDLYIPDLQQKRLQIGNGTPSGSTYVITELDGAFNKYYEVTLESDFRQNNLTVRGTYTWSHYYGNFDQDNTTTNNDASIFMGSSFIADGVGTQIWDNKYGDLRGDRRHLLKLFGSYALPWNATVGVWSVYQSGQPWEIWDYTPYQSIPGFSGLNDINRYAEPAGRRHSPSHYQFDMRYSQQIPITRVNLQVDVDAFNLLDKQTGYNIDPRVHGGNFGNPRDFYDPRRFQIALRLLF